MNSVSLIFPLLHTFSDGTDGSNFEGLNKLEEKMKEGKKLFDSFQTLSVAERQTFFKQVGKQNLSEMLSLSRETDEELFFENLLHFAIRLKSRQEWEKAGVVLNWICRAEDPGFGKIPEAIRAKAREELQAIRGEGSVGMRLEFLLSRFAKEAIDYRMILPMMAGTVVSARVSVWAASRLPRWSPSLFAAATGFAAEVPTFVLAGRLLSASGQANPKDSVLEDLGTVGTSLGLMKLFGVAGGSLARRTNGRFLPFAIPQASMFLGLAAAHRLEEKMGLRPPSADRGIFFVDTLSSWLSLNVGAALGRRFFQDRALRFPPTEEFPQGFRSLSERVRNFVSLPIKVAMTPEGIPLPLFMVNGSGGKEIPSTAAEILKVLISSPDPQTKIRALRRIPSLAQNASQAHQMLLLKSILKGVGDPHPKVRTAALRYFEASRWSFPKDELFFIVMEQIPEMEINLENESAVRGLEMLLGVSQRPTVPVPETISLPEENPLMAKTYVLHLKSPLEASPALWEQEVAIELKVGEAFTLGRSQGPFEIEPHQRDVSRAHLTLIRKEDGLYVVDGSDPMLPTYRHSMTGVSFNGIRLRSKKTPLGLVPQEAMIRPGDSIEFGRGFTLEIKDPAASSPLGGSPELAPEKKPDTLPSPRGR